MGKALIAAVWLVLAWAALTPAQALPRIAFDASLAVQRDLAPNSLPRQLEADLPDLVDTAHPAQFDSDAAVPPSFAVAAVAVASSRTGLRPYAVPVGRPLGFNPRAPPGLR